MLVRIDTFEAEGTTVIQLAGQLGGEAVAELERTLEIVSGRRVVDVSLLRTADAAGISTLRSIVQAGGELRNVSRYLQLLLEGDE